MGYVALLRRIQGLDELLCRKPQFSVMQGASQAAGSKSRKMPPGRPFLDGGRRLSKVLPGSNRLYS